MASDRTAVADAIVVAAGSSVRMGGADKLGARIGGRPLLAWTLDALIAASVVDRVVVVTAPERIGALQAAAWLPASVVAVVPGADRRQGSVAAGLEVLERLDRPGGGEVNDRVVLVHDGARPLVSPALVEAVAMAAAAHGAAIPVVPMGETVKRIEDGKVAATIDRTRLATAQTPQGIRRSILLEAFGRYPADGEDTFTDEAALLEACSIPVHVVDGDPGNLKVTLPADLARAESALVPRSGVSRTGIGHDSHPFGPGRPLVLGGIRIEDAPRLHGHSDGDVVLHAMSDALLGAAGLGDLGRVFPAGPQTPAGIDSAVLLREVVDRVQTAGWRPASIDVTIVAARPRLGSQLDSMRDAVAAAIGLDAKNVSVKASTGNLDGMEGAGRGISALAIAVLEPAP
jgi:2-C-methyl-D-erythritol 4-phosphate cytidylyltransferase/2-C-methyl-D-erythritol 2,4-cyclodiphosphate synthase